MERGSSVVECRTRNQVSPGSNPPLLPFRYLAIDSGGNVSDLALARNCCLARMLPGEAELVSEWTGLPGEAKSVKRFERSNGLDTALYKNYLYLFFFICTAVILTTHMIRKCFLHTNLIGWHIGKSRTVSNMAPFSQYITWACVLYLIPATYWIFDMHINLIYLMIMYYNLTIMLITMIVRGLTLKLH